MSSEEISPLIRKVNLTKYVNRYLNISVEDEDKFIEAANALIAEEHPSDHEYREHMEFPGVCNCGWISKGSICFFGEGESDLREVIKSQLPLSKDDLDLAMSVFL